MILFKSFMNTLALTFAVILGIGVAILTLASIWIMIARMTGVLNAVGAPL